MGFDVFKPRAMQIRGDLTNRRIDTHSTAYAKAHCADDDKQPLCDRAAEKFNLIGCRFITLGRG